MVFRALLISLMVTASLAIPHHKFLRKSNFSEPINTLQESGLMEDPKTMSDVSTGSTMQSSARCACVRTKRETNVDESTNAATYIKRTFGSNQISVNTPSGGNAPQVPAAGNDVSSELSLISSDQVPANDSKVELPNIKSQNVGRRLKSYHARTRYVRGVGSDGDRLEATSTASSTANKSDESRSPPATSASSATVQVKSTSTAHNATVVPASSTNISANHAANKTGGSRSLVATTENSTMVHVDSTSIAQNDKLVATSLKEISTNNATVVSVSSTNVSATVTTNNAVNKTDESRSSVPKTANSTTIHVNSNGIARNATSLKEISTNNAKVVAVISTNVSAMATRNEAANKTDGSRPLVATPENATIVHVYSTGIAQNATQVATSLKEISTKNATVVPVGSTNISATATTNEADAYTEKFVDHYGGPDIPYHTLYPATNVIMVTMRPKRSRGFANLRGSELRMKLSSSHHLSASAFLLLGVLLLPQLPFLTVYLST